MNYYNDIDPFCCEWIRNQITEGLIPDGKVDDRSICDVQPEDLRGFAQCHFFAGIGGGPLALRLAGWPADEPVWSGSCPCQPLSCAGKRKGHEDERHLWPQFHRLISECRPATIFGEQVASKDGLEWLDGVSLDLEELGYAVGAADLPAAGVGAPHIRQRVFWLADAECDGGRFYEPGRGPQGRDADRGIGEGVGGLVQSDGSGSQPGCATAETAGHRCAAEPAGGLGNAHGGQLAQSQEQPARQEQPAAPGASWSDFVLVPCADGKLRRVSAQSGDEPLAHGLPRQLGPLLARLEKLGHDPKAARRVIREARRNRVGRLRGYGNAIVPAVAAAFIRAYCDGKERDAYALTQRQSTPENDSNEKS